MYIESTHRPYVLHKNNIKCIIDLKIKYKTINIPKDSTEKILDDLGLGLGSIILFYLFGQYYFRYTYKGMNHERNDE